MNNTNDSTTAPHLPTAAQAVEALRGCLDTLKVRRFLFGHLHSERASCPHCGVVVEGKAAVSFWEGRRVACKNCRHFFTAATGTAFSKSKLSDEQIFLLLACMGLDLDNRPAAAVIGVNASSVRENRQKIEALQKNEGGQENGRHGVSGIMQIGSQCR
ncbi:MAG: hypothetical protein PHI31_12305 [Desulfuromonadaceae bacterium]|nr:hypothetical protein [Desulfuromonadaceae bacterium]